MQEFTTIAEVIAAARKNLQKDVWDYAAGGAGSETTLRRNRAAIERYAFKPRVLRDVSQRSLKTQLLGHTLELPVLLAPVGSIAQYHPDGPLNVARVAGQMGAIGFMGGLNTPSLEEVMAEATGPMLYQIYVRGDRAWLESLVRRVEAAGYSAVCITVDSPLSAFRDRDRQNRHTRTVAPDNPNLMGATAQDRHYQASLTWEEIAWLRSKTRLPLMLKGILTPEDALLAVEHGVDVVYVCNHGGRELDYGPATLDVLPSIVQAVAGRAEVIVDSGFMRGTDILKGIALGARAVAVGRLLCWALAARGSDGLRQTLEILREEMDVTLGIMGVSALSELGPEHLTTEVTQVTSDMSMYQYGPPTDTT